MKTDENYRPIKNTFDRTVFSLCLEIDNLKEQVEYWKQKYEDANKEHMDMINEHLNIAKRGVGTAILIAMSAMNDENGNLVIDKDDREMLAKRFKKNELEVDLNDVNIDVENNLNDDDDDQLNSWYDSMAYTR